MFARLTPDVRLNAAAVLIGSALPALVLGRAAIGIFLGLSLILTVTAVNHRDIWQSLKPLLTRNPFLMLLGVVALGLSVNIAFSLRPGLSLEAWGRSFVVLALVYYTLYCLRHQIALVLKALIVSAGAVLLVGLFLPDGLPKSLINGLVLMVPICGYVLLTPQKLLWKIFAGVAIILSVGHIFLAGSKVSLLGFLLVVLCFLLTFLANPQKRTRRLLWGGLVLVVLGFISTYWLTGIVNSSSDMNRYVAIVPVWMIDLHRQLIWMFALDLFQHSPWVGFGLNASNYHPMAQLSLVEYMHGRGFDLASFGDVKTLPSHPHNWIVEMALDAGLVGLVPMLGFVIYLFANTLKRYFATFSPALLAFLAVNAVYWGTGLFNFSFWSMWWQVAYFVTSGLLLMIYLTSIQDVDEI